MTIAKCSNNTMEEAQTDDIFADKEAARQGLAAKMKNRHIWAFGGTALLAAVIAIALMLPGCFPAPPPDPQPKPGPIPSEAAVHFVPGPPSPQSAPLTRSRSPARPSAQAAQPRRRASCTSKSSPRRSSETRPQSGHTAASFASPYGSARTP